LIEDEIVYNLLVLPFELLLLYNQNLLDENHPNEYTIIGKKPHFKKPTAPALPLVVPKQQKCTCAP
jgi:hypothetical protein